MSDKPPADPTPPREPRRETPRKRAAPRAKTRPTVTVIAARPRPQPPAQAPEQPPAPLPSGNATPQIDIERLARNIARMVEEGGKALAAYMRPREEGKIRDERADAISDVIKTLARVLEWWLSDPQRAFELQTRLGKSYLDLWLNTARRLAGENPPPIAAPDPKDRRFADPEWTNNQFFDFLKQAYLLTTEWANRMVADAEGLDPHTRHKAEFYVKQIANAVAPSNFVLTNPEVLRETLSSSGENLVRGMHNLAEDIRAGGGELRIRQSDTSKFEVGVNLALSPGKVIYQNDLMQLIQYAPSTQSVLKTPLLIVPPWINKYYVLDLTPDKSFIKWCVDQGVTVFCISWVNPDARHAGKGFDDYMTEGPLAALDIIQQATGEDRIHALGYCVGGTLLAVTLAYMAQKGDDRIASATLLTTQVDFTHAGDLKVFAADEEQVAALEREMGARGYLDGSKMAAAFNLLRSNDLIWPYVIGNYLKGQQPFPFDMLYWNSDSTRMPCANHSFYLRACYLENRLAKGTMAIANQRLDLKRVTVPVYNLAAREDHIAPARSVYLGSSLFGGPVRFVLAGSGHMAGVVNHPAKNKYQHWTGDAPQGNNLDQWTAGATEHPGSWWPDWMTWLKAHDPTQTQAREPGGGKFPAIEDAPGSYVKVRS